MDPSGWARAGWARAGSPGAGSARPPIAVALDASDAATAVAWAAAAGPHVAVMKVGLQTFLRDGAGIVALVRDAAPGTDLFLDLKLHDIPNTVAGAARSLAPLEPAILTVHASGGAAMVAAAAKELPDTRIAAVTVLTSLSAGDLADVGFAGDPRTAAVRLARLAVDAGAGAVVCSPHEVAGIREAVGPDVLLITPGVRPAAQSPHQEDQGPNQDDQGPHQDDQARVATPQAALAAGADLLVIGRPITGARDPGEAARAIAVGLAAR